jgi:BlaR1 peptidase M56
MLLGVERFAPPLLLITLGFGLAPLFELAMDVVRLRRIKRAAELLGTLPIRNAGIGTSPTVPTPTAIGYFHPAIIVPAGFREQVDAGEWDAVVAHECAHLARHDDWAKAVQSVVLRACWWLPGLWLLGRRLDLERELASDERAAPATGARRYAACLLRLATGNCADALAPGLWGRRSHLAIRVERLLRPRRDSSPIVRGIALGAFSAIVLAVLAAAVVAVPAIGRHEHRSAAHPPRIALAVVHQRRPRTPLPGARRAPPVAAPAKMSYPRRADVEVVAAVPVPHAERLKPLAAPTVRPRTVAPADPATADANAETVVVSAYQPRRGCATCFGTLHHAPEGAFSQPDVAEPSPGPFAASSPLSAEDTGSGPASPNSGFLWLRLPRALVMP